MAKRKQKTQEQTDLELCTIYMNHIEKMAHEIASVGSAHAGRSWVNDSESSQSIAEIFRESVQILRHAYRKMGEAETILIDRKQSTLPVKPKGLLRGVFA